MPLLREEFYLSGCMGIRIRIAITLRQVDISGHRGLYNQFVRWFRFNTCSRCDRKHRMTSRIGSVAWPGHRIRRVPGYRIFNQLTVDELYL